MDAGKFVLQIQDLKKSFKADFLAQSKLVLPGLSFAVSSGKTTGFVGVNGAGKTTTLKCVLGFVRPDSGKIDFFGQGLLDKKKKEKIGYLPERPYFYEFLTAFEFLKFHWDLSGGGQGFNDRAREVLSKVNLLNVEDKRLRSFSKGMLQRVGLAQALLRKPSFLILDEPMSGLDPDGRALIKDIIQEEKERGTSIFFSSHLLGDMDELCDELVVIDQGQLVFSGALQDFTQGQGVEKMFRSAREKNKNSGVL